MKPLGTITMCFPHVDEETRSVLQSVMEEAEDHADFTERLCDRVCKEPSPILLEYFAVFFSFQMDHYALIDRLDSAGKVPDMASPIVLLTKERRGMSVSWDDMKAAVVRALSTAPNEWIVCHLFLFWRFVAEIVYPESDVDIRSIDAITLSVDETPDLAFFKSYLLWFEAMGYLRDNKRKEVVIKLKQALAIARKFDERIMEADFLCETASHIKHTDVKQAIDLLTSSKELNEKLGYKNGIGQVHLQLGHIMGMRGELDAAIEYQIRYKTIRESLGLPTLYNRSIIAFFHNQTGNGEEAFRLAKTVLNQENSAIQYSYSHAQLAWALINLGRYDEASVELAVSQKIAMKSGQSRQVMHCRLVEGVFDKVESRFDSAIQCFNEVLKYIEKNPVPVVQNICLLNLTEIEIEMLPDESLDKNSESSGPWMRKLAEYVENNDIPGIAARALLLKAELRRKQGLLDEVRKILEEVHETANTPSMKYLNDLILSMFPEITIT